MKPITDELAHQILCGNQDERLKWSNSGAVQIRTSKIFPEYSFRKTIEGRSKRLVEALEERLIPYGWRCSGPWWHKTSL